MAVFMNKSMIHRVPDEGMYGPNHKLQISSSVSRFSSDRFVPKQTYKLTKRSVVSKYVWWTEVLTRRNPARDLFIIIRTLRGSNGTLGNFTEKMDTYILVEAGDRLYSES